jgi:hypothetical protein
LFPAFDSGEDEAMDLCLSGIILLKYRFSITDEEQNTATRR